MKTIKHWWILPFTFILLMFTACKDDDDPTPITSEFETLTSFMVTNNMDLSDMTSDWIIGVPKEADLDNFLSEYYVIDIRSASDFAAGHIEGAANTTLANIVNEAGNAGTKTPLVVCYSGQTAGHAVVALRLSGYGDAKVLKFGMSQWDTAHSGPWVNNSGSNGNKAIGHPNWVTTPVEVNQTFEFPEITTGRTSGQDILEARVEFMLQNGFQGVNSTDVLDNPNNYFINNYWDEGDVDLYGHIAGSYRVKPLSIAGGQIENLDPDKAVVTYCWTGQTSSIITAWLTVLGYETKSLKFGANNMIYENLEGHKYAPPTVDLPVVTE